MTEKDLPDDGESRDDGTRDGGADDEVAPDEGTGDDEFLDFEGLYGDFGEDNDIFDVDALGDPLPDAESWQVAQDLDDLDAFEQVFAQEGLKGVSMYCHDCEEEHFYRWDLLRNSLELLLETGEIPVHEPAFQPNPDDYVPWEYARGYIDALRDVGVDQRMPVDACPRCAIPLEGPLASANWCPRCATPLLGPRLATALEEVGLSPTAIKHVLRAAGLPGRR